MCPKLVLTSDRSPSARPRNAKHMDVKDVKMALDIIFRPSLHICKLALGRGVLITPKRPQNTAILCENTSSTSSITLKKKVRFDAQPVTISRKRFFDRYRKGVGSSPARPCLVVRHPHVRCTTTRKSPPDADCRSVYEDCLSDYPGCLADLQVLEGDGRVDTRSLQCVRRSDFYETESGIASFDRTGYANYCLSKWLDKQREEARAPKQLVFEDPALLPWPSRTLPPPSNTPSDLACPVPPPPSPVRLPPRSLSRCIWKHVEDELENAIVVLTVGFFIHICLFLFLLYDVLTRGLIPSDD